MYATYVYAAGATQANVLADLIKLLTGTTDKTTLSAACVQASTTITSVVAAGWSVYDASAGTNEQCIRAINQDGATYKYFNLQLTSTIALGGKISEAWNAGAHTGTNVSALSSSVWASAGGGTFYVYATSKNIWIKSLSGGTYQALTGLCVFEMSRDTIPSGYPCFAIINGPTITGVTSSMVRVKTATGSGDTLNPTSICTGPLMAYSNSNAPLSSTSSQIFRSSGEVQQMAFYKMGVTGGVAAAGWHHYGTAYDIYLASTVNFNDLDEIVYNGVTYAAFKAGTTGVVMVPKQ